MSSLGTKIVEGRKKKGMSQEVFSARMGVTRQTVSKWELDISSPRLKKIKKISEILDISIEELLAEKNEKKSNNGPVVTNSFNYKKLIKRVTIAVLVIFIVYVCYAAYKLIVLNSISAKLRQYMNVDNYHFKIETLNGNILSSTSEVWYKDGFYKIIETNNAMDVESKSVSYIDLKNKFKYVVNEQEKTYTKLNMYVTEAYDNGILLYNSFPSILKSEVTNYLEYGFKSVFVLCTIHKDNITLKVKNEEIKLNKETLLPISDNEIVEGNKNAQENILLYNIELECVTDDDVKISTEYLQTN